MFFGLSLLVWILFNVLPVKRLCGIRRDEALEEGGTGDVSYHANIGWRSDGSGGGNVAEPEPSSSHFPHLRSLSQAEGFGGAGTGVLSQLEKERAEAIHCKLLRVKPEEYNRGRLDMYYPPIPAAVSDMTAAAIVEEYRLFERAVPGDPSLLPGQKSATGGPAHVAPPNRRAMAAASAMHALNVKASAGRLGEIAGGIGGGAPGAHLPPISATVVGSLQSHPIGSAPGAVQMAQMPLHQQPPPYFYGGAQQPQQPQQPQQYYYPGAMAAPQQQQQQQYGYGGYGVPQPPPQAETTRATPLSLRDPCS